MTQAKTKSHRRCCSLAFGYTCHIHLHGMFIVSSLRSLSLFNPCSLRPHFNLHRIFTSIFTPSLPDLHFVFTSTFTSSSLHLHSVSTWLSLDLHLIFTWSSLDLHLIFTWSSLLLHASSEFYSQMVHLICLVSRHEPPLKTCEDSLLFSSFFKPKDSNLDNPSPSQSILLNFFTATKHFLHLHIHLFKTYKRLLSFARQA